MIIWKANVRNGSKAVIRDGRGSGWRGVGEGREGPIDDELSVAPLRPLLPNIPETDEREDR